MIEFTSVENILQTVLAVFVIIIFGGAIYSLIRSILLFVFSHGEAENRKKARNWIRFMIIGLILTVVLLFLFQYILKYMGVEEYEQFSASNIFQKVTEIVESIISLGQDVSEGKDGIYNIDSSSPDPSGYEL